jgi:integrase/recombinase XerD
MSRTGSSVSQVGAGPLAPFTDDLRFMLEGSGYRPFTVARHLREVERLGRWMEDRQVCASDLTLQRLAEYRAANQTSGCPLAILGSLRTLIGNVSTDPTTPSPLLDLLAAFRCHLLHERGLVVSTVDAYVLRARRFLAWSAPSGDLSALTAADVTRAVLRESQNVSVRSTQYFITSLRSFLRFCFVSGVTPVDMSAAALGVSDRRGSSLPLGISNQDADALLRSFDRQQPQGRRDYAVVLILLRLGLRSAEVASLTVDDLDWRVGEVLVHGKGDREEQLPLPTDVGEAIVSYLQQGRPGTTCRAVFLRRRAPIAALGRGGVSAIVRRASLRAGMAGIGAHRLRHTLACEMVTVGVPLPEIGQVLRHRSLTSTANYARVDLPALRGLAQPWPEADGDA